MEIDFCLGERSGVYEELDHNRDHKSQHDKLSGDQRAMIGAMLRKKIPRSAEIRTDLDRKPEPA